MSLFSRPVNRSFTPPRVLTTTHPGVLRAARSINNSGAVVAGLKGSRVKLTEPHAHVAETLPKCPSSLQAINLFTVKIVFKLPDHAFKEPLFKSYCTPM
jgi:hypothetical protein